MVHLGAYVATTVALLATGAYSRKALHIADEINANPQSTWRAYPQDWAASYPNRVPHDVHHVHNENLQLSVKSRDFILPQSFDARTQWPLCNQTIGNIRDQSACGSCWAVSSASVFSDRVCIASGGRDYAVSFSADDTMSCCTGRCGDGCSGGYPGMAWNWFVSEGVVTGGNYTDKWGCAPYPFPPHGHGGYKTPECQRECQKGWTYDSYANDKYHAHSSFRVEAKNVTQMQLHLLDGTLVVCFAVYEDFFHYKSGVYQRSPSAQYAGMHAVRLIGWGEENGVPYWLVANSWDTDWGMGGYFKILRGQNECGIEETVVAGEVLW